ncbi:hypothetical protein F4680DRAFT_24010 [Xylaria scruposa]|nr:hypothetical protein F4680DRAFT_24010 [Xylaria scruposa]
MEVDPYYTMDAPTQTTSLDHDPEAAPHPSSSQVIEIKADRLNRRLQEFQMLASSGIIQLRPVMLDTKRASSETRETTSPPGIVRTIYKDTGDRLSDAKTYRIVSEPQYDGLRNNTSGPAIEMNKVVKVIPPPKGSEAIADIEGHYMLDGEIVDRIKSETMTIRSQSLLREMKKVIYWPTLAFYDGQQKLEINYPYRSLSVHRHELGELLDEKDHELEQTKLNNPGADVQELERMLSHFRLVLQEVDKVSKEATVLEEQRHTRNVPVATFDLLWKLFSPGQNVFVYENDYEITARVRLLRWDHGTILDDNMDRPYVSVTIHLWYLDHDGSHITPRLHHVVINRYPGEKPISELPVQPDRFVDPDGSKHREIVTRGRKYLDLFKQDFSHALYDGYLSRDNNPYHDRNKTHFEGNVIIDPVQYAREKGSSSIAKWSKESDLVINSLGTEPQRFHKLSPRDNKTLDSIFEDDHCFLLPQWIAAFTIGARGVRNWGNPDRGLCDRIAMPKEQCDNIKALMFYRRPSEPPPDADVAAGGLNPDKPIPEKGEGRIILLHGSPGVGKTYTVECLAQWSDPSYGCHPLNLVF